MSVYDTDNFMGRVNLAASYISQGRNTTRTFDTCFEMSDGDAVATALYRRAQKAPSGRLASNLWSYLSQASVEPVAVQNAYRADLKSWAAELRAESRIAFQKIMAEQAARQTNLA